MVLADPEHIQAHFIGVLDLVEQVAKTIGRTDCALRLTDRCRKAINANFHVGVENKGARRIVPGAARPQSGSMTFVAAGYVPRICCHSQHVRMSESASFDGHSAGSPSKSR